MTQLRPAVAIVLLAASGIDSSSPGRAPVSPLVVDAAVRAAADSFVAWSRGAGEQRLWPDFSDATRQRQQRRLDAIATQLHAIDGRPITTPADRLLFENLREAVEGDIGTRICRLELWATLSQIGGWQLVAVNWARSLANADSARLAAALPALRALPAVVTAHQSLLRRGMDSGFTAPAGVVDVVVRQLDALTSSDAAGAPLILPARQAPDSRAAVTWRQIVTDSVYPVIRTYRAFLSERYRPRARADGSLATMRTGAACYRAWLRDQTSVDTDPLVVMVRAREVYDRALRDMAPLVARLTGSTDVVAGIRQLRTGTAFAFSHRDSILPEYQRVTALAASRLDRVVSAFKAESLVVAPYSDLEERADLPPRYLQARANQPARFLVNLGRTERMSVADAVAHEGYPGHHLQRIASMQAPSLHPAMQAIFFGSFIEGWGIYAEDLGDEMGLYDSDLSRAGYLIHLSDVSMALYLDVGHHVRGWTRAMLVDSMMTLAGRSRANAEAYADRHAATPGQLATYYIGWRAIRDVRDSAERALGARFDSRAFHDEVLRDGSISLASLASKVQAWTAAQLVPK